MASGATTFDPKTTPWRLDERDFPVRGTEREQLAFLLRYAVLAPSSHNTQPWRFRIAGSELLVSGDRDRWLKVADRDRRELFISLGCALENLLVAAEHFGFGTDVTYDPSGGRDLLAAVVRLVPGGPPSGLRGEDLFRAIGVRHTNHRTYAARALPPQVTARLRACCVPGEGVALFLTGDPEIKRRVHGLVVHADAVQFADPAWRKELGYWIGQGAFGAPWLVAKVSQLAVTHLDLGQKTARADSQALLSAPLVGVISSTRNDREAQVRAGQLFERICLTATHLGVALQPMSQIVQLADAKAALASLLPGDLGSPQQPFRLGYAEPEKEHTPRRRLEEVLN